MDYWCVSLLLDVFYRSLNVKLRLLIGKLVGKMNSNRFISCLVDQKLIRIIRISALTFMSSTVSFDLIFFITLCYFLNCEEVLPEFCIDIDVFFLWVFYWSFVCSFLKDFNKVFWHINYYYYYYCYYISIIIIIIIILDSLQVLQRLQGFWKRRLFYLDTLFQLRWVLVLGPYTFKSVITLICSWLMLLSTIKAGVEVCFRVAHAFLAPPTH